MRIPTLTLITITKDDSQGITRTLASTSRWRALEWVEQIVVDGSAVPAVLNESSVQYMRQAASGIARAFNEGLAKARGEWVWFINGGDEIDPRLDPAWLKFLLDSMQADVLIGGTTFPGGPAPRLPLPPKCQWPSFIPWIPHPSTLVHRSMFSRFGDFDPEFKIAMDFEWWLRALSGTVSVDQVSVPFAIFAPGGVSSREDMRGETRRETAAAVWKHRRILLRSWGGYTKRMVSRVLPSLWQRL
ncbi:MAG: glycosyltransferase [Opitutaceae bacterium]|jgi:glycosyltransferase involved in cell wall biosynthesis